MANGGTNVMAILALVFGIIGLLILPIVFGPLAIIFGIIGLVQVKNDPTKKSSKIMAIIGLILGIVDVLMMLLILIWFFSVF